MNSFKTLTNIVGWLVFATAMVVFYLSAERTGSLWDCGEFVSGCYKLQVVHPPGAPFFLLVGRLFTVVAKMFSNEPSAVAFAVNLLSGACTALAAMFVCWTTIILGKLALVGRDEEPTMPDFIALAGAGIVAGLCTAFASSIWFSAVEGEVYAMSTMFTTLTLWAMMKWYNAPDVPDSDRWILFAVYAAGLSIGVHLLSLLTFPALALFYYFKKYKEHTIGGMLAAALIGIAFIYGIQTLVITGIPKLWGTLEIMLVNGVGLPFILPSLIVTIGIVGGIVWYAFQYAHRTNNSALQNIVMGLALTIISFSAIGMVMIRANANTPINMNNPSDPLRLIPYLNREQYGERPLLYGPSFAAQPIGTDVQDRYGRVGDRYEVTDRKIDYIFDSKDKMFFPRMGHYETERQPLYKQWMGLDPEGPLPEGRPNQIDNISYFLRYQVGWMYWRYFMWNFTGRQNGDQGFSPSDVSSGNWISGINAIDNSRLFDQSILTETMKKNQARNKYYFLPLLFGIFGLIFHYNKRREDFMGLLALFIITGIGIIIYSNEPPNEPRERDYVLVGSLFTYCIWIGMGVLAIYSLLKDKVGAVPSAALGSMLAFSAPMIMLNQNFNDNSRAETTAARDYASNFLNSCEPNSIIFTYGDNDTYPLWYCQEVEGIRTDVRVVNLSLIAVDWYIEQLRRKVNKSPAIKMSIPEAQYKGFKRNQVPINTDNPTPIALQDAIKYIAEDHPVPIGNGNTLESICPGPNIYIPVDKATFLKNGLVSPKEDSLIVDKMTFSLTGSSLIKDDLAVLDIIASNISTRPIYFAVTCRPESVEGLQDYLQLEGLATRLVPIKTPSERTFGLISFGGVNADRVFENITKKFKWGNFDKEEQFISSSYAPSVQSMRFVILRSAMDMVRKGDKARAVALVDKYFEAFPHKNFPYDYNAMYMINVYQDAGFYEKGKKHMQILAKETADQLRFFAALSDDLLASSYGREYQAAMAAKNGLMQVATKAGDTAYMAELEKMFAAYPNPGMPKSPTNGGLEPPSRQQQSLPQGGQK